MRNIIDNHPELKITNLEQLPRAQGRNLLLVIESPFPGEYAAIRWLRKMPSTTARCHHVVRL